MLCVVIVGCMEETEPIGGGPGLDGVNATGKDETAPSSAFVSHEHQHPRRVQSGSQRRQSRVVSGIGTTEGMSYKVAEDE